MKELSGKEFGVLIGYVVPGFVALWGVRYFSPTVNSWILASGRQAPTVAGFMYVTLASLAAGLTVSAVRWALIDTLHHSTGVRPPEWDFGRLDDCLHGFLALVENHYRFYQFYSNMFVAVAFTYRAWLVWLGKPIWEERWATLWFLVLEVIFFTASRDALRKYYARAERLLGTF
jgi:hypothetical protein